ncbi:MAG TPA: serine/threonine-protein kinase [Streptosporangiaceae bacterium]|nr:serine/threonine-protein kinase [Streptosporangiaceae bacterium]
MMVSQSGREPLRRWDPDRIGPYVILGRLGAGAMGQVYLGRSPAGRLVAVKTIKVELAEEAGFRTRFAQEVAAARRVSGVFTASVVEADPEADLPWLATAYVPAPSLSRLVRTCGPLPIESVRWLAAGCAEALVSIHRAGLVHRDLKPSNVLVAPDGPRVIDFGVARAAERIELTGTHGAVGTPAYMAPEQARDTKQASVASDVYSLGATLAYAATGHPPYEGETTMDVLARLANEPPDLSGLPDALTELVNDCMERVPRMRPTSSAVLARLGPFTEVVASGLAAEHSYLPETAMDLIREYQRSPLPAGGNLPGEDREDATNASLTDLPASHLPRSRSRATRRGATARGPRWIPAGLWRWGGAHVAVLGWVAGAAALVVVGVVIGASLNRSAVPNALHNPQNSAQAGGPPGGGGPPPAPATVCGPVKARTAPALCMVGQSQGQVDTAFVVRGTGFDPRTTVTVTVLGASPQGLPIADTTSRVHPVVGRTGGFSFAISRVYPGSLQLGQYTVAVREAGRRASTAFMVIPPPPPSS